MNIRISLILFILALNFAFADVFNYEQNLSYIIPKMPQLKNISAKFNQDKYITSSNVHLKSSGNFKFEKDNGVTFYTTYPIKSNISYSSSEYRQINYIIKAIANKNYKLIEKDFKFFYIEENGFWSLGLVPKNQTKIQNYISSIEISGKTPAKEISKLIIITKDNIKTTITLSDIKEIR